VVKENACCEVAEAAVSRETEFQVSPGSIHKMTRDHFHAFLSLVFGIHPIEKGFEKISRAQYLLTYFRLLFRVKQENETLVYSGCHYCSGRHIKLSAISWPFGTQFRMTGILRTYNERKKRD